MKLDIGRILLSLINLMVLGGTFFFVIKVISISRKRNKQINNKLDKILQKTDDK